MKTEYGKWRVEETLKRDRCFLASSEGQKGVVKIGRNVGREVKLLNHLQHHPNIITLLDYDLEADTPYLVTEYHTIDLNESVLGTGLFSADEKIQMCRTIAEVVKHCNDYGIVCDLSLPNIVITEDRQPVLIDFESQKITGNLETDRNLQQHQMAKLLWEIAGREYLMRKMIQ